MNEAEAVARANEVIARLRDWVMSSQKNLDLYTDIFHDADEGKRQRVVLEIVVGQLAMSPADAAMVLSAMKESWKQAGESLREILAPPPHSRVEDDDCPF